MPKVQYGDKVIEYTFLPKEGLKSHYISVQKDTGVVLKGSPVPLEKEQAFILKKARWILEKLELVEAIGYDDIVTGSRIPYLGKKYYVEVFVKQGIDEVTIDFTESKFKVKVTNDQNNQDTLQGAFEDFFRAKAQEKILPKVKKWAKKTGLDFKDVKIRKLEKRWGSCTPTNSILINIDAIKLPFSLIDYLIVHELVHTKVKSHSKEFWAELSKHIPNWKELDDKMYGMKL
ncbi:M48 family metallopeptidase [Mariniflexile gromovii]|uniref:M48 family metallopeptidase n=1 Tax=Mariniflexile gromovii TaxID=362523 RepID=A0ABS4BWI3_9FLAO|nr:SprT family zinc-dependent metalloprotease [Mariniflexile gromovii]MBP0904953.1 M48 family metallopeptidase [Mariniflexile gromovii]